MDIVTGGLQALESAGPTAVWLVVVTFVFLECAVIIGLFLPGDSLLITAGVVLASAPAGEHHLWALSLSTIAAAVVGNQVGYVLGRRTGSRLVTRPGGRYLTPENLHRVKLMLERHGFWAVLIARWIPWVRTLCPMVAGAAEMNHRSYTVASTIGAVIWAPVLLHIGFHAGGWINRVDWLMPVVIGGLTAMLLIGTAIGLRRYRQEMSRCAEEIPVAEV